MSMYFPVVSTALNTGVQSDAVTLSGLPGIPSRAVMTSANAVFILNGLNVGTDTNVSNGDLLAIRIINTGSQYATATHAVFTLGLAEYSFTSVTLNNPIRQISPSLTNTIPVSLTKYQDGSDFIANGSTNTMRVYSSTGSLLKSFPALPPTSTPVGNGSGGMFYSPQYFSDFVLKFDVTTREVLSKIRVGAKPYGVAPSYTSTSDPAALRWVTVSALDKVVCINSLDTVVAEYPVGQRPLGIASTTDGAHVWVANNGSGTVTHFKYVGSSWTSTSIAVGPKPFEIALDSTGTAWVTDSSTTLVARVTQSGIVTFFEVGNGPRGIAIDASSNVWVACSQDNTVVKLSSSGAVLAVIPVQVLPFALTRGTEGSIYVSCFGSTSVQRIVGTAVFSTFTSTCKYPYDLYTDQSGNVWVAEYYSNTPDYTYLYDQTTVGIGLTDALEVPKAVLMSTNTITVLGINTETPASIPNMLGAVLIKNSLPVGTSTTVVADDHLSVQFTTPDAYSVPIEIPLFVGETFNYFISKTAFGAVTPNAFSFNTVTAAINTPCTSNAITISGLGSGLSATCVVSGGSLIKNGTLLPGGTTSTSLVNGDTLSLTVKSSTVSASAVHTIVTIGTRSASWAVLTGISSARWIKSSYAGLDLYDLPIPVNTDTQVLFQDNSLFKINAATSASIRYSLYEATAIEDFSPSAFINAISFYENTLYKVSRTGVVSDIRVFEPSYQVYDVAYAPKYSSSGGQLTRRFVTLSGTSALVSGVVRELDSLNTDITLPVQYVYGIDSTKDGQYLYVATGSSLVYRLVRDPISLTYSIDATIDCYAGYGSLVTGGLRNVVVDSSDTVWVTDVTNGRVIHLNGLSVSSITKLVDADPWDIVVDSNFAWVACSYSNSVAKLDRYTGNLLANFEVAAAPSSLCIEELTGNIWVGHYGDSSVSVLDASTGKIIDSISLGQPVNGFSSDDLGNIWAMCLNSTLEGIHSRLQTLSPALPLTFTPSLDVVPNSQVFSNTVTILGLTRNAYLSVSQLNNQRIYLNGSTFGETSVIVSNGDEVKLSVDASDYYGDTQTVRLYAGASTSSWTVANLPDTLPDEVNFESIVNVRISDTIRSNEVTITGLSTGCFIPIRVLDEPYWTILVNDLPYVGTANVKQGDVVSIGGPASNLEYLAGHLEYALQYGTPGQPLGEWFKLGTFTAYGSVLEGPVPRPIRSKAFVDATSWEVLSEYSLITSQVVEFVGYSSDKKLVGLNEFERLGTRVSLVEYPKPEVISKATHLVEYPKPEVISKATHLVEYPKPEVIGKSTHTVERPSSVVHPRAINYVNLSDAIKIPGEPKLTSVMPSATIGVVRSVAFTAPAVTRLNIPTVYKFAQLEVTTYEKVDYTLRSVPLLAPLVKASSTKAVPSLEVLKISRKAITVLSPTYTGGVRKISATVPAKFLRNPNSALRSVDTKYVIEPMTASSLVDTFWTPGIPRKIYEIGDIYSRNVPVALRQHVTGAMYTRNLVSASPTVAANYETGINHISPTVKVSYVARVKNSHYTSLPLPTKNGTSTSPKVLQSFARNSVHVHTPVESLYTKLKKKSLVTSPVYVFSARPHKVSVEISQAASFERVYKSVHSTPFVGIVNAYEVRYSVAGSLSAQGLYSTADAAIRAGKALGHVDVSSFEFRSVTGPAGHVDGIPTVSYMWVIPPEVDSRNCGSEVSVGKYPIPHRWYVQGG